MELDKLAALNLREQVADGTWQSSRAGDIDEEILGVAFASALKLTAKEFTSEVQRRAEILEDIIGGNGCQVLGHHTLCDSKFRTFVLKVVVAFERQLELCTTEEPSAIVQGFWTLILPPLLKLLQCVHALWMDKVASILTEELKYARLMVCSEYTEEAEPEENEIRKWLEEIRERGYNIIGMSAKFEGAFWKFSDSSSVGDALMKDLESMEFRHLTLLIRKTIIPLLKRCPAELWKNWVNALLRPVFHYFHFPLFSSWCKLLYEDIVLVPGDTDYICLSKEDADKIRIGFLHDLTRAASDLLAVIAHPELNGVLAHRRLPIGSQTATSTGWEFICSSSLVGRVLYQGDLVAGCGDVSIIVLSLIHYIWGAWKDDEARITSIPFCDRLIELATATHNDELISCIQDSILPNAIRCLALEPEPFESDPYKQVYDRLFGLCEEAYYCVYKQDAVGEEKNSKSNKNIFKNWLTKQMEATRHRNIPLDELEEFVWIWEIEKEFMDSLPAYIDMLHVVDESDDCLEDDYDFMEVLFEKLNPKFTSEYAIDSAFRDYFWTMSVMLSSRKRSSEHWLRQNKQMYKFFCELIVLKPYIRHSGCDKSVHKLLMEDSTYRSIPEFLKDSVFEALCVMLSFWEPQFHPLIREGHKDVLTEIFYQSTSRETITCLQPFGPDSKDFLVHLQPYAENYIDTNEKFKLAREQASLHENFDEHLASAALDDYIRELSSSKGDAVKLKDFFDDSARRKFSDLDDNLLKLSFERRAKLLGRKDQLYSYYEHLKHVIDNEQLRNGLQNVISELEEESFFKIDDDSIDWEKKRFSELIDAFDKEVFTGLHLPKHYVVRGIMDFWEMSLMKDGSCSWTHVFKVVVDEVYQRWMQNLDQFWTETRYYEHDYYDMIQQPLKKISWTRKEN